ncbi:MAG: hypothetical protein IKP81_08725 [Paludibacteraceae bacterium]|nr:hypothetical protein [Paludibacteraceae bacterium]
MKEKFTVVVLIETDKEETIETTFSVNDFIKWKLDSIPERFADMLAVNCKSFAVGVFNTETKETEAFTASTSEAGEKMKQKMAKILANSKQQRT